MDGNDRPAVHPSQATLGNPESWFRSIITVSVARYGLPRVMVQIAASGFLLQDPVAWEPSGHPNVLGMLFLLRRELR